MLYHLYESTRNLLAPWVYQAKANADFCNHPRNLWSSLPGTDYVAAMNELFYRIGKDYEKPDWGISALELDGETMPVRQLEVLQKPFCKLLRFRRYSNDADKLKELRSQPSVLVVAPLSGHHATLLRDTVRTLMQHYRVYVTDWVDARMVAMEHGDFGLDDYVEYVQEFIRHIGTDHLHVMSVCQPVVPTLAAISLMAARGEPTPRSMVMMGGPIDARLSPTAVNDLALNNPLLWFKNNVIYTVPALYPGKGRHVYPGFLQHTGFLAMNPRRHLMSHWDFYNNLVKGDMDDAAAHRRFYDEYNAVLDMPAKFYLDTIEVVFQKFLLPKGKWFVRDEHVDPSAIRDTALLSIEGEFDDISGLGQTQATQQLCSNIPADKRDHFLVKGAGHYGIFSGRRWREVVYPKVHEFFSDIEARHVQAAPVIETATAVVPVHTQAQEELALPEATLQDNPVIEQFIEEEAPVAAEEVQQPASVETEVVLPTELPTEVTATEEEEVVAEIEDSVTTELHAIAQTFQDQAPSIETKPVAEVEAEEIQQQAQAEIEVTTPTELLAEKSAQDSEVTAAEEAQDIVTEIEANVTTALQAIAQVLQEEEPAPLPQAQTAPVTEAAVEPTQQAEEVPAPIAVAAQSTLPLEAANEQAIAPAITEEADTVIESGLQAIVETLQPVPLTAPAPKARKPRKSKKRSTPPASDNEVE